MAKFPNFCALLAVVCCVFMTVQYAAAAPKLTVRIYHGESERYVRGTQSPVILYANGTDPDLESMTLFYPHQRPGSKTAFESVRFSTTANRQYLVMNEDGTLSISKPKGKIYEFSRTPAGKSTRFNFLFATVSSGATCYVSFDNDGNPLPNQCNSLSGVGIENAKLQISAY